MVDNLPPGWACVALGDVCRIQTGFAFKSAEFVASGTRLLRGTNLVPGGTRWTDIVCWPADRVDEFAEYLLGAGDIVIGMDRPIISSGLKVARLGSADVPSLLLQRVGRFLPGDGLDPGYLYCFLRGDLFRRHIAKQSTGTQLPHVSGTDIETCPVLVPPVAEQKRIVARIEGLTARSRRAKEALDAVPPLLDRLRQSILAAAFRGDLTEDWRAKNPDVEPADSLVVRIRTERRTRWEEGLRNQGRDPAKATFVGAVNTAEPLHALPQGWAWSSVGELCDVGTGATPKRGEDKFWANGTVPWITSGAVNHEFVNAASEFVTERALRETNLSVFPPGTLLVAMYGEGQTRGRCSELGIAATTNQALAGLVTTHLPAVLKEVIKFVLWDRYEGIRKAAAGGVQPNLNLSIIRGIAVPVPPQDEQAVLVPRLRTALTAVQSLASRTGEIAARLERLDEAVLAKAFRGELVPQDPSDEPASVLLDQVQAARDRSEVATGSRHRRARTVSVAVEAPDNALTLRGDSGS